MLWTHGRGALHSGGWRCLGETERMTLWPVRKCDKKRKGLRFRPPFKGTYQELPPGHTFKNFQSAWPESAMLRQRQRRGRTERPGFFLLGLEEKKGRRRRRALAREVCLWGACTVHPPAVYRLRNRSSRTLRLPLAEAI